MKLVLVHGSGCVKEGWYYQVRHFPDAEAVDLPGHPKGKTCSSAEEYTDWLRGYIKQKGYKDVVLCGHSLGGAVALLYALKYAGDLKGLILISTGAKLKVHPAYVSELEEATVNKNIWRRYLEDIYRRLDPKLKDGVMKKQLEMGPALRLQDLHVAEKFDVLNRVKEIRLPTLVMCGGDDALTPVRFSQYLADNIPGAKLVVIHRADHYVFMERPDEANKAIEEFLKALPR